jgi:ribosome-binding factor A
MVLRDLDDPRVPSIISITRVKVSSDLSVADVYITAMGTEGQQTAALNALRHSAGMMRGKLTRALALRQAPFLKFHIDENLKKELNVLGLLDQVRREREERERQQQGGGGGDDDDDTGVGATDGPTASADEQDATVTDDGPEGKKD